MKKVFVMGIAAFLAACAATPQEQQAWDNARSAGTVASYRAYLTEFPNGFYAGQAIGALENALGPSAVAELGYTTPARGSERPDVAAY
jgi:hypothetical protein